MIAIWHQSSSYYYYYHYTFTTCYIFTLKVSLFTVFVRVNVEQYFIFHAQHPLPCSLFPLLSSLSSVIPPWPWLLHLIYIHICICVYKRGLFCPHHLLPASRCPMSVLLCPARIFLFIGQSEIWLFLGTSAMRSSILKRPPHFWRRRCRLTGAI